MAATPPQAAGEVNTERCCSVAGQVIDFRTSLPVAGASVTLYNKHARRLRDGTVVISGTGIRPPELSAEDEPHTVTADAQGRFSFTGVAPGIYALGAMHEGSLLTSYESKAGPVISLG